MKQETIISAGGAGPETPAAPSGGWRHTFRALKHRNYALFFSGQGVSLVGTWMQSVSQGYLVFQLTRSAAWLGLVAFSGQFIAFVLFPFAGVIGDRWNRRPMLVLTQSVATLQAVTLTVLTYTHRINEWWILGMAMVMGVVQAFDIPIRQSFVVEMVGRRREDLPSAIALNSALVNGGRMIGPAVAGLMIDLWGVGPCFLANAVSFLAVIAALLAMNVPPSAHQRTRHSMLRSLRDGLRYAMAHRPIRWALLLLAFTGLMGQPYQSLLPAYAETVLAGSGRTLGFLVGAAGVGALCGAVVLASRRSVAGLEKMIAVAPLIFGAALVGLGASRWLALSMPLLLAVGFGMMTNMASTNTLLQTLVDEHMRSRVMSFYSMAFMGMSCFGNLILGSVAGYCSRKLGHAWGVPIVLWIGGGACVLGGLFFSSRLPAIIKATHVQQPPPLPRPAPQQVQEPD